MSLYSFTYTLSAGAMQCTGHARMAQNSYPTAQRDCLNLRELNLNLREQVYIVYAFRNRVRGMIAYFMHSPRPSPGTGAAVLELRRKVSRAAAIARGKTLRRTPSEAILSRVSENNSISV